MAKNWLKQRSEILAKYAEALPVTHDNVQISFDAPKWGWMSVHFMKNEVELGLIDLSNVYDSFGPLRDWLEGIAEIRGNKAIAVNLDCEDYHVALYYDPIWFFDYDLLSKGIHPEICGIFSIYDGEKDQFLFDAYCKTSDLVKGIYKSIIDYAKAMRENPDFIEHWVEGNWNHEWGSLDEDDPRMKDIFLNKMTSPKIEEYLQHCARWRR